MINEIQGSLCGRSGGGSYGGYSSAWATRYGSKYIGWDFRTAIYEEAARFRHTKENPTTAEPFVIFTFSNTILSVDTSVVIPTASEFISSFLVTFPQYKLHTFSHVDCSWSAGNVERTATVCFAAKEVPEAPVVFSPSELAAVKAEIKEKIYLELRKEMTSTVYDLLSEI